MEESTALPHTLCNLTNALSTYMKGEFPGNGYGALIVLVGQENSVVTIRKASKRYQIFHATFVLFCNYEDECDMYNHYY